MTRDISIEAQAASIASTFCAVYMVDLLFESEPPLYIHSGVGFLTWGGNTYSGIGQYGSIENIEEPGDLAPTKLSLNLSGVDSALVYFALAGKYQGREGVVRMGFFDYEYKIIEEPVVLFKGLIDGQMINLGEKSDIRMTLTSRLAAWDKPKVRRYNNQDQQILHPGDKGLEFVEQTVDRDIFWGAP